MLLFSLSYLFIYLFGLVRNTRHAAPRLKPTLTPPPNFPPLLQSASNAVGTSLNLLGHIGKREYEIFGARLIVVEKHGPIPLKKYTPSLFNILIGFDGEMGISPWPQDDVEGNFS